MEKDTTFKPLDNLPEKHEWQGPDDLWIVLHNMFSPDPSVRPSAVDMLAVMAQITDSTGGSLKSCCVSKYSNMLTGM